jgi:hypothetical protein
MALSKCLTADSAGEGTFTGVGPEVSAEVVGTGEAFGAEIALKCGRLYSLYSFFPKINRLGVLRKAAKRAARMSAIRTRVIVLCSLM